MKHSFLCRAAAAALAAALLAGFAMPAAAEDAQQPQTDAQLEQQLVQKALDAGLDPNANPQQENSWRYENGELREEYAEFFRMRTGLVIDAYFSATKLRWLLDNVPGARARAERGELLFGTVDTWLLWKLTGGQVHATDATNASRTMLYNINTGAWDEEMLRVEIEALQGMDFDLALTGFEDTEIADFLTTERNENDTARDIITNPPYKCFSSDTECYTKSGWKNWQQLNKNDEVLSINPNTLKVEWSEINQIIHYEVNENMYHFKKSNMDILCTSDHRMFAYSKNGLVYKDNDLIHSQNIRTTHYIPRNGYSWEGNNAEYFILPAIDGFIYAQKVYKEPISILMLYFFNNK